MSEDLFSAGIKRYEKGEYSVAYDLFLRAAIEGSYEAMTQIAVMLEAGLGIERDTEKSIEWDLKAIAAGSKTSLINLGITYRRQGDIKASKNWFERAFAAGDGEAAFELARLYSVSEKEDDTIKHYLEAATRSDYISEESRESASRMLLEMNQRGGSG
jgi:uncharacterized protein